MANPRTKNKPGAGARVSLLLDPAFYPRRLIKQAAQDFAHLAAIDVEKAGDRLRVEFCGMNREVARNLPDEFANYLLALFLESR
jgi:hypothetical protein